MKRCIIINIYSEVVLAAAKVHVDDVEFKKDKNIHTYITFLIFLNGHTRYMYKDGQPKKLEHAFFKRFLSALWLGVGICSTALPCSNMISDGTCPCQDRSEICTTWKDHLWVSPGSKVETIICKPHILGWKEFLGVIGIYSDCVPHPQW